MSKVQIYGRVQMKLKEAAIKDAKKRGMNLSKYIETALIHELNRKSDSGTIHELENLQIIISQRIEELQVQNPEENDFHDENVETAVKDVADLQNTFGYVTEGAVKRNAKKAGKTFEEFLQILKEENVEILITK